MPFPSPQKVKLSVFVICVQTIDITQLSTDEGWRYLAGIMDGFSKRMLGYAMAEHMKTELVLQALGSAVLRRKPGKGLIHHSDKGSQYTSYLYQHVLHDNQMLASFTLPVLELVSIMPLLRAFGPP